MTVVDLCSLLQSIAHEGYALYEVDEIDNLEVVGAKVIDDKVVLLTKETE